jgi:predicted nuclease of restriction endonuclease-like (RecB) superfamily
VKPFYRQHVESLQSHPQRSELADAKTVYHPGYVHVSKIIKRSEYGSFLSEVKTRIKAAQYDALKAVNKELITLYWDIGKMILSRQENEGWGKAVVNRLAEDLQKEFSGMQGFSPSNLWRMRLFYESYSRNTKLAPLVREIAWAHNIVILERCKDALEREFYIRMTKRMGWSRSVLIHQIENKTYEKTVTSQTNFKKTLPARLSEQAKLAVKDEYTFDFLELGEEHSEMELERALIARVNQFLVEMGGTFAFMGNQFRLEIEGNEYFIDILLYHRRLRCLVAIELKVGEFRPEFVGKMQFYLAALDARIKAEHENPSIGIVVCKEKKRVIVEYALKECGKPIAVAQYRITTRLSMAMKKELPSPRQIQKLFEGI